jgi:hypothetical protein
MAFVVKKTGPTGINWLGTRRPGGLRTFGSREKAEIFLTFEEAYAALREIPRALRAQQVTFTIESVRFSPWSPDPALMESFLLRF